MAATRQEGRRPVDRHHPVRRRRPRS
jgi:hypothetical protein